MNLIAVPRRLPEPLGHQFPSESVTSPPGFRAVRNEVQVRGRERPVGALRARTVHRADPQTESGVAERVHLAVTREAESEACVTHVAPSLAWLLSLDADDDVSPSVLPVAIS